MGLSPDAQEQTLSWSMTSARSVCLRVCLLKDGPLTLEERRLMQEHPAIGEGVFRRTWATSTPMLLSWFVTTTRGSTGEDYAGQARRR